MRNQKAHPRLQNARGQMFVCGMFGNCANAVLSPRTPPGMQDFGRKAAIVWAANDCTLEQQQIVKEVASCVDSERPQTAAMLSDCSPSVSDGDNASSTSRSECSGYQEGASEGRSSTTSEVIDMKQMDLDELLVEVNAGHFTKITLSSLNKLAKENETQRGLIRTSGIASSLISLLLSSNLGVVDNADVVETSCVWDDERDVSHNRQEAFAVLAVLSEDDPATSLMATPEMLSVVLCFLSKGSKEARENASLILEKLSLIESFKGTMGAFPQLMNAIVSLLREEKQLKVVKLAAKTLLALCLLRENRIRAIEADAVGALLEMLSMARSATAEKALATLELLGTIEEGKVALIEHALAVPVLVDMILRVSDRGTEYAAGTLSSICSDSKVMQEAAVAVGAPTKLLLLIQSDCTARAKRKASQLLKVLHKLWGEDPCNPDSGRTKAIHF